MKVLRRWKTNETVFRKFYLTTMWKWNCFCPIYLIICNRYFIPFGYEVGTFSQRWSVDYYYHMTILNFDFYWRETKKWAK